MSKIEDLNIFFKKKGFMDTLQILCEFENFETTRREFYNKLNSFSYSNSFLRLRKQLLDKKLIKIEKINNKHMIKLTDKGIQVYNKLMDINNIINEV